MADQLVPIAYTSVQDAKHKLGSFQSRVSLADAQAYCAAANDAARLATNVGILLAAVEVFFEGGDTAVKTRGINFAVDNDAFLPVDIVDDIYNSNKITAHYSSTVLGINRSFVVTIPQRNPASYTASGGILTQGLADATDDFVTALSNVGLSPYGTVISPVMVLDVNDN